MSDPHATDAPGHPAAAGGDHHDVTDHAPHDEILGPIDVFAWGAGIIGVVIAVAIAVCFSLATSVLG